MNPMAMTEADTSSAQTVFLYEVFRSIDLNFPIFSEPFDISLRLLTVSYIYIRGVLFSMSASKNLSAPDTSSSLKGVEINFREASLSLS